MKYSYFLLFLSILFITLLSSNSFGGVVNAKHSKERECLKSTCIPNITATPNVTDAPTSSPNVTDAPTSSPNVTDAPTSSPNVTDAPTSSPNVTVTPTLAPGNCTNNCVFGYCHNDTCICYYGYSGLDCSIISPNITTTPNITDVPTLSPNITTTPNITDAPTSSPNVTDVPTISPNVTVTPTLAPGNCTNNCVFGYCQNDTCICYYGYSGLDCSIISPNITTTPNITDAPTQSPNITDVPTLSPNITTTPNVTGAPTSSPNITVTPTLAPGNCTNNCVFGHCQNDTCICYYGYSGLDCSIPLPTQSPNITDVPTLSPNITTTPNITDAPTQSPNITDVPTQSPNITNTPNNCTNGSTCSYYKPVYVNIMNQEDHLLESSSSSILLPVTSAFSILLSVFLFLF